LLEPHYTGPSYFDMKKFFVNLLNFYYTRDAKLFDHQFALKENRIALLIGLIPTIVVSLILVVIGLTQMGITFIVPDETAWVYVIGLSIPLLVISRGLVYLLYKKVIKDQELIIVGNDLYKRYYIINVLMTFLPLVIMFLIMYLVYW
jgi:hypothetical protein